MKRIFSATLLLVMLGVATFAQLSSSNLVGTVSSPDGLLPGATVTVRDNKTGKEVIITTSDTGSFRVSNLEIGLYTVTVAATGFKTFTANEVRLETGREYSLNPVLEVGGANETVTVTAGADVVNSSDAKLTGTVSNVQLTELPLLTRNPLNFITLQAGVQSNPAQPSTINGVRTAATNITIEGINVQDNFIRSNATDFSPARPLVDEVEEFAVVGQANVEDGFGSGQIQFPIRRGGNRYTGSIYDYNRNSELAANSFFNNAGNTRRSFRNRNEFGGRLQGPLPFFNFGEGGPTFSNGKDKLFFFVLYQKTLDRQSVTDTNTVLTQNARNGLFTYNAACTVAFDAPTVPPGGTRCPQGITPNQLVSVSILNPALNTGITAIDPTIQGRFISPSPLGNSTLAGDQRNTTGFRFNQTGNSEQTNYTTRIDYKINDTNAVRGIYRYVYQTLERNDADASFNVNPTVVQPSNNPFLSLGYTTNISSNFSNELVGGFSFSNPSFLRTDGGVANFIVPTLISSPENTFVDQGRNTKTYNLQDNATFVAGNHSIRFGGQLQVNRIRAFDNFGVLGTTVPTYTLGTATVTPSISTGQFIDNTLFPGGVPTAQRGTANGLLALLGGIVTGASQGFNVTSQTSGFVPGQPNSRKYFNEQYATYISDQWRIRPDLTLNIGLRYDYYTPVRTDLGLFFEPNIASGGDIRSAILDPNGKFQFIGNNIGRPGTFHRGDKNNFGPNASFAYAPRFSDGIAGTLLGEGKTVFRGGYRLGYINDELFKSVINAGVGSPGLVRDANGINPNTGLGTLNARVSSLPVLTPPTFISAPTFAQNNALSGNFFATVYGINPDIKTPKVHEFNFGVQREIGFQSVLEVRYVGTRSRDLLRAFDLNQVNIRSNGFLADFNRARNNLLVNQAERTARINALVAGGATVAAATTTVNTQLPESAAFNANLAGSQVLTVFPRLGNFGNAANSPGLIGTAPGAGQSAINATIANALIAATPADLAVTYFTNGQSGGVGFLANPNAGPVDLLDNGAFTDYNSLQVELRRRFANGFLLQANYTFSKALTNSQGATSNDSNAAQNRFDPFLDNENPDLEFARALTDQTHVFNANFVYQLPFGKGRQFFNEGGLVNAIIGGFQFSGTVQIGSGAPVSFNDPRGTLNRAARSARQTAKTNLTKDELKNLIGVYRTPNGIFFLPPEVLGRNADGSLNTAIGGTGRGANGFGSPTFQGQIFFNNAPGETSALERNIVTGPSYQIVNLSLAKKIQLSERYNFQVEINAFNAFNKTNFTIGQGQDINSVNFGRITGTFAPRVVQLAGRFNF